MKSTLNENTIGLGTAVGIYHFWQVARALKHSVGELQDLGHGHLKLQRSFVDSNDTMNIGVQIGSDEDAICGVIVLKHTDENGWLPLESKSSIDFHEWHVTFYYNDDMSFYGINKFDNKTKARTFQRLKIDLTEDEAP
ncbi:MAG: hypothetical protein ACJKSS_01145 [Patescibacteria group bacterium UBA2103]